jgi:hypothetical protein
MRKLYQAILSFLENLKLAGYIRLYYLFVISNLFIDGQIIDFNSFRYKFFDKKEFYINILKNKQS